MSDQIEQSAESQSENESLAPAVAEDRPRPGSRPWLAILALILAFAALGLSFWQWQQQLAADASPDEAANAEQLAMVERIDGLEGGLDALESDLSELDARLDSSTGELGDRLAGLASLEQTVATVTARVDAVQGDISRLEDEFARRIETLAESRGEQRQADRELERRLLMLEASSLLRLGQERAELAADWPAARESYRRASALLQQADDPRLGGARRELARELNALESIEAPDWLRIQARIERLSGQAPGWPRPAVAGLPAATVSADDEAGAGWTDSLKTVFGQLVRVRPRDTVVLSDEEVDLLRQQVALRLTAAELAAARRDAEELAHHLRSARQLLTSNFDSDDSSVIDALRELDALATLSPASVPSGLGRALVELREHMDRS